MQQNYKRLGDYIRLVDERNRNLAVETLLGVSVSKEFIKSIANTVGTDFSKYKIVRKNQFTYIPDTSRRGDKIGIALLNSHEAALVSQAYSVFEIIDKSRLAPEYLMMWFRRPEFDRYARFKSHGSARETFDWNEMIETELPIPSIEKQKEMVAEYQIIENRIRLNNELCQKLEETAQTVYRHWFEDFEFPVIARSEAQQNDEAISTNHILQVAESTAEYQNRSQLVAERSRSYKSSGGEMIYSEELGREIPKGWKVGKLGDIVNVFDSRRIPLSSYQRDKITEKIYPYYGASCIMDYVDNYLFEGNHVLLGEDGTVITERGTPILQFATGKFWVNNHAHVLKAKNDFTEESLYIFLDNSNITDKVTGAVQLKINQANLLSVNILIPAINVLSNFNDIVKKIFDKLLNLSLQNQKLEELKSLLLGKMAVEG